MYTMLDPWAGTLRADRPSAARDRQNVQAFEEAREAGHVSLIDRLRGVTRRKPVAEVDLVCCAA